MEIKSLFRHTRVEEWNRHTDFIWLSDIIILVLCWNIAIVHDLRQLPALGWTVDPSLIIKLSTFLLDITPYTTCIYFCLRMAVQSDAIVEEQASETEWAGNKLVPSLARLKEIDAHSGN